MTSKQFTLFITSLIGSGMIIALTSGVFSNFLLFLFVGKIPGTSTYLTPSQMGVFLGLAAMLLILLNIEARQKAQLKQRFTQWRQNLPKRRYTQA